MLLLSLLCWLRMGPSGRSRTATGGGCSGLLGIVLLPLLVPLSLLLFGGQAVGLSLCAVSIIRVVCSSCRLGALLLWRLRPC